MGDILSEEEIEALLKSADESPILQLMEQKGVARKDIAAFYRLVDELDMQSMSEADMKDRALDAAGEVLGKDQFTDKQWSQLKGQVARMVEAKRFAKAAASGSPMVSTYDFKHPARVNKDQLRTLESLHDNFARLLSSTFSGAMRAVVDVDTAFVDQTTYAEFIMSLSNPSCSYQFTLGPTGGQAIMDFAMPVVFGFVDRIFGGRGSSEGVEARQMSQIEMGVIAKIVKRAVEDLEATWEPILPVEVYDIELETNPEFMQITAPSEIVILLAFEVNSTNTTGLVSLCYPFFTLESILPRLGQQTYVRRSAEDSDAMVRRSRTALGPTPVPMVVELGRNDLAMADARSLAVGDVICSTRRHAEPCIVHVGGEPKFYARPFAETDGRVQLQIVDRVPAELQPPLRSK